MVAYSPYKTGYLQTFRTFAARFNLTLKSTTSEMGFTEAPYIKIYVLGFWPLMFRRSKNIIDYISISNIKLILIQNI